MITKIKGTIHVTATQIRNIKTAYKFCQENGVPSCRVGRMDIIFKYDEKIGHIRMMNTQEIGGRPRPEYTTFKYEIE